MIHVGRWFCVVVVDSKTTTVDQSAASESQAAVEVMTSEIIATTPADALTSVVDIQQDFEASLEQCLVWKLDTCY